MFKGLIDRTLNGNSFRSTGSIIYNLAYFAQGDVPKNTSAGLDRVTLDFFYILANHCNGAPTHALRLRQVDGASLCLKQILCICGNPGQYCREIQCDRDLAAHFCKCGSFLCATPSLLEEARIFNCDGCLACNRCQNVTIMFIENIAPLDILHGNQPNDTLADQHRHAQP